MERQKEIYLRQVDGDSVALDIYFKISEISESDSTIIEVSDAGIIVYDTRISRKAVSDKFNFLTMVEITKEDFENRINKFLNKKENE